ncbi:OBSCN [Mytilus coruscus]|uniref:OBSCN n=1 Tax=Mytilus coruscus TaxID=42192 RepID=A0A6J8B5P3_MYTCO|nr:OBSCN [Mytilus coruscus]
MGRIQDCFKENSDVIVELLSKHLNQIVFKLHRRNIITDSEKLGVECSLSPYLGIRDLFYYIEVNNKSEEFIEVLNQTDNGGIAHLVRLSANYYFTSELKNSEFAIGTDVVLSCEISNDRSVQWFKNGIELSTGSKYTLKNDVLVHQLIILNAQEEDAGDYLCECCYAKTKCRLKAGLQVIKALRDLELVKGETLHLSCKLNRDLNVKWLKNGKEILCDKQTDCKKTSKENLFKYTLRMKDIKMVNSGEYSCVCGNFKTSCFVIITDIPIEQIINARTTEKLYEIQEKKEELAQKEEKIVKEETKLLDMKTEIKNKEMVIKEKIDEIESQKCKLAIKEEEMKQREVQLELKEAKFCELEREKKMLNKDSLTLLQQSEELKFTRANAKVMQNELDSLKDERRELEKRIELLEKYIDNGSETHKNTITEIRETYENMITQMKAEHTDSIANIAKTLEDMQRKQSGICVVS